MSRPSVALAIAILIGMPGSMAAALTIVKNVGAVAGVGAVMFFGAKLGERLDHYDYQRAASRYPHKDTEPATYRNATLFNDIQIGKPESILERQQQLVRHHKALYAFFPRLKLRLQSSFSAKANEEWHAREAAIIACKKDIEFLCGLSIATSLGQAINGMRNDGWFEDATGKAVEAAQPKATNAPMPATARG